MSTKSCGGCQHFLKVLGDGEAFGICQLFDGRTNSDNGSQCKEHKSIPYKRIKYENKTRI